MQLDRCMVVEGESQDCQTARALEAEAPRIGKHNDIVMSESVDKGFTMWSFVYFGQNDVCTTHEDTDKTFSQSSTRLVEPQHMQVSLMPHGG